MRLDKPLGCHAYGGAGAELVVDVEAVGLVVVVDFVRTSGNALILGQCKRRPSKNHQSGMGATKFLVSVCRD